MRWLLAFVIILLISSGAGAELKLQCEGVELNIVLEFFSQITGYTFVKLEPLNPKITAFSPEGMEEKNALDYLELILESADLALVKEGQVCKIVHKSQAREESIMVRGLDESVQGGGGFLTQVIPLKDMGIGTVLAYLAPLVSRDGYIMVDEDKGIAIVVDWASNIRRVVEAARRTSEFARIPQVNIKRFSLVNATPEAVAKILDEAFSDGVWLRKQGLAQYEGVRFFSHQGWLVAVGRVEDWSGVEELVRKLDAEARDGWRIEARTLNYADGKKLQETLVRMLPEEDFVIGWDERTNTLIYAGDKKTRAKIGELVRELDRREGEVLVELLLAELSLDWRRLFGLEGAAVDLSEGAELGHILQVEAGLEMGAEEGLYYGIVKNLPISELDITGLLLHVLGTESKIRSYYNPKVLVVDGEEGKVFVGEEIPVREKAFYTETPTEALDKSIAYHPVGIEFACKPRVKENGAIELELTLSLKSVGVVDEVTGETQFLSKSAHTKVVLEEGQLLVIGGLDQFKGTLERLAVPYLENVPVIGKAMGKYDKKEENTSLLIFVRARRAGLPSKSG